MCLAIPGKVVEICPNDQGLKMAKTQFGGIVKQVCVEYLPDVEVGDYVLAHVGFALSRVDAEQAERTYRLIEEMDRLREFETPESNTIGDSS